MVYSMSESLALTHLCKAGGDQPVFEVNAMKVNNSKKWLTEY